MATGATTYVHCNDGCGRTIDLEQWECDGPETMQPDGFVCKHCTEYCANECGDRALRTCDVCKAYHVAQDFTEIAKDIEHAIERGDVAHARMKLLSSVAVERDLSRRLRVLEQKKNRVAA